MNSFIETSKSLFDAPVFFVKITDGSLRMVCDWWGGGGTQQNHCQE